MSRQRAFQKSPPESWWRRLPRWFVGLVLVSTGVGKGLDMDGFAAVLAGYDLLPGWANSVLAHTLPFIELAAGICLLAGWRLVMAGWTSFVLHAVLLAAALITLHRGIALSNCGCFGVFLARPLTFQTVVEDGVLLALSLVVVRLAKRRRRWQIR